MKSPAQHRKQDMRSRQLTSDNRQQDEHRYALCRGLGFWELTFESRKAIFKNEQGALYAACLLLDPPSEPIHAVALTLKARSMSSQGAGAVELIQQRSLGLDDAEAVRALWRRQRVLERVIEDDREIEPVR